MPDELARQRALRLADRGYALVAEGEFTEALEVARQIEAQSGYSAAYEIGGLAYAGMGELEAAVQYLEDGLKAAPGVWLNWQLLGNYRSDLGLYAQADEAYAEALQCEHVERDSVMLNRAIVANRMGQSQRALQHLDAVADAELVDEVDEVRIHSLRDLGRYKEALQQADALYERLSEQEDGGDEHEAMVGRVLASRLRTRLQMGEDKQAIRDEACSLVIAGNDVEALSSVVRQIDDRTSADAQYWHIFFDAKIPLNSPLYKEAVGFMTNAHVVADNVDEALRFIADYVEPKIRPNLFVEQTAAMGSRPDDRLGLYWMSERAYYKSDQE